MIASWFTSDVFAIESLIVAPRSVAAISTVLPQLQDSDLEENRKIEQFAQRGCMCTKGPNSTPCCQQFTIEHYSKMRCWCAELSRQ